MTRRDCCYPDCRYLDCSYLIRATNATSHLFHIQIDFRINFQLTFTSVLK